MNHTANEQFPWQGAHHLSPSLAIWTQLFVLITDCWGCRSLERWGRCRTTVAITFSGSVTSSCISLRNLMLRSPTPPVGWEKHGVAFLPGYVSACGPRTRK